MAGHWTYEPFNAASELEQGDILRPTSDLRKVFADVHPHFGDDKYLAFLIATQSCDLVRRGAAPKAAYVNLAVVRPLTQVIRKLLTHVAAPVADGVFRSSRKYQAKQLLQRIFNQNEQALGLFFLQTDEAAGIAEPAVAFLRVTVALRAEHYPVLQSARVGRVTSEFRAKLGWLIGNLYVRPATRDWEDTAGGKKRVNDLVGQFVDEVRWLEDSIVDQAAAANVDIAAATDAQLELLRPKPALERAIEEVGADLVSLVPGFDSETLAKLQYRLRNNDKLKKLIATGGGSGQL
jgi:hypothetical protein